VVTSELLENSYEGQTQLLLGTGSVLTPSGRDFVQAKGLEVIREQAACTRVPHPSSAHEPAGTPAALPDIQEVTPGVAEDHRIIQEGRCEHPDRACGCTSEEFGSGFVEPDDCEGCTVKRIQREGGEAPCQGCNRQVEEPASAAGDRDTVEVLVQVITDQVVARLRQIG